MQTNRGVPLDLLLSLLGPNSTSRARATAPMHEYVRWELLHQVMLVAAYGILSWTLDATAGLCWTRVLLKTCEWKLSEGMVAQWIYLCHL